MRRTHPKTTPDSGICHFEERPVCVPVCAQGAFWGLMVGLVVGVCRMVLEFAFPPPRCGVEDSAPAVLRGVHYLHFAILLCGLTAAVIVAVSLLTPPPTHDQVCTQKRNKEAALLLCETPVTLSTEEHVIIDGCLLVNLNQ